VVYITEEEEDGLGWSADSAFCVDVGASLAEASDLLNELRAVIDRPSVRRRGCQIIGVELARAFQERVAGDTRDFFAVARQFVDASLRERLHLRYVVAAFVTTCVVSTACVAGALRLAGSPTFFVAAALGGVGALVSVTQRFRRIPLERYSSSFYTAAAGVSRICVGAVFGALFLMFQKAGLLLAIATDQPFLLFSAAFVAGFSERMIPEILERLETTVGVDDKGTTA
jgi:hypothetical protein